MRSGKKTSLHYAAYWGSQTCVQVCYKCSSFFIIPHSSYNKWQSLVAIKQWINLFLKRSFVQIPFFDNIYNKCAFSNIFYCWVWTRTFPFQCRESEVLWYWLFHSCKYIFKMNFSSVVVILTINCEWLRILWRCNKLHDFI